MSNPITETGFNQNLISHPKEIQEDTGKQNLENTNDIEKMKLDINSKILDITLTIKEKFSELSMCLEELPNDINPKITLANLKTYQETLNSLLNNYILDKYEK